MVAGASAGGCLAAAVALKIRDHGGPALYGQMLIHPMLDDLCMTSSMKQFKSDGAWTGIASSTTWDLVLPGRRGTDEVSIYEAPGRATTLNQLPPTYTEVGSTEAFRDECILYATNTKLCEHGVETEFHM